MNDDVRELVDGLESELRARAELCGWTPVPSPQLLRESSAGAGVQGLVEALAGAPSEQAPRDRMPPFRRAMELQPASLGLLLGVLDEVAPEDSYRAALWWAGLVRSEIAPTKRSDLHLFLVAPKGTSENPDWQGRRSRIESDERFCRKFVWLPSQNPTTAEITAFLDRTFLAQPWQGESAEPRSLDPLERMAEEAASKSLTLDEARRWITRLASLDGIQQIAEDLASILEGQK